MDNVQQIRDDETDGQFVGITSSCFSRSFCYGASALLASYDPAMPRDHAGERHL